MNGQSPYQPFSLRDFYSIIFRRKRLILISFSLIMLAVCIYLICAHNIYRSSASIIVNVGRESVTLDPTATTGQRVTIETQRESEINSEAEILKSDDIAENVVNTIGAPMILNGPPEDLSTKHFMYKLRYWARYILTFPITIADKLLSFLTDTSNKHHNPEQTDKAIQYLQTHLNITALKKTDIITIDYDSGDPGLSRDIVTDLIHAYLIKHLLAHQTEGSYTFFTQQKKKLKSSLETSENNLRIIKNHTGIASIREQTKILLERIGGMRKDLGEAQSDRAATSARINILKNTLARLPSTLNKDQVTGFATSSYDEIQKNIYQLQLREHQLLTKYKENTPPIIAIRRQIRRGYALLSRAHPLKQVNKAVNTNYQTVQLDLVTSKSHLAALNARIASLSMQITQAKSTLNTINNNEMKMNRLERELAILRSNYIKYSENREQARIDQALQQDKISNIRIVQPASYSVIPIRPKRKLLLVLGLFLATFLSLGMAFLMEYLDHSLRNTDDINTTLQLPVLTTVPHSYLLDTSPDIMIDHTYNKLINTSTPLLELHGDETSCRALLDLSIYESLSAPSYALGFVSCRRNEGTSTIVNLVARQLSLQNESRILVVDTNIYNPMQHLFFNTRLSPGFTDITDNCFDLSCISPTSIPNIDILTAGTRRHAFSACSVLVHLLSILKDKYTYLIFDLPSMDYHSPILHASRLMNGIALVLEAEKTRREVALSAKEHLRQMNSNVLGVVLNKQRFHIPDWLYKTI